MRSSLPNYAFNSIENSSIEEFHKKVKFFVYVFLNPTISLKILFNFQNRENPFIIFWNILSYSLMHKKILIFKNLIVALLEPFERFHVKHLCWQIITISLFFSQCENTSKWGRWHTMIWEFFGEILMRGVCKRKIKGCKNFEEIK